MVITPCTSKSIELHLPNIFLTEVHWGAALKETVDGIFFQLVKIEDFQEEKNQIIPQNLATSFC